MHTYRFRILSDVNEDFLMDIELKSNQTFLDFHNAIKSFCNINSQEIASFFICDDKWRRKNEITLTDMGFDEQKENENAEPYPMLIMEKVKLNQIIIDPHQRFLYVYDFFNMHTFYVELILINKESSSDSYPKLVKKEGDIQLKKVAVSSNIIGEDDFAEVLDLNADNELFRDEGSEDENDDIENIESKMYFSENDEI